MEMLINIQNKNINKNILHDAICATTCATTEHRNSLNSIKI